jgi:Protein of unknown function (DUF2934)
MPKRKPVEAAEAAPVVAEPKKTVRKVATSPKTTAANAVHKHHSKKNSEPVIEAPVTKVATQVTQEAVAQLAYSYWEARGYQGGSPEQDWLRAEQELFKLA